MTEKANPRRSEFMPIPALINKFHLEAERTGTGIEILVSGIIGVKDFCDESVELLSHSGRVFIYGRRLSILVFENGTVQVSGRVESVRFGYGKN